MSKEIEEYDDRGNRIYWKFSDGLEYWYEYDENNNCIYQKHSTGYEYWSEYDGDNRIIYGKHVDGNEYWYEYDKNNNRIEITEKVLKKKQYNIKIREYNSRTKCSRFEIMEL